MRRLLASLAAAALLAAPVSASAGPPLTGSAQTEACHTWNGGKSLTSLSGYIGAAGWILLFDDVAPPPDGTVTAKDAGGDLVGAYYITASGSWSLWFDGSPLSLSTGLVACASSTGPLTKTSYATALFRAQVQ